TLSQRGPRSVGSRCPFDCPLRGWRSISRSARGHTVKEPGILEPGIRGACGASPSVPQDPIAEVSIDWTCATGPIWRRARLLPRSMELVAITEGAAAHDQALAGLTPAK